MGVKRDMVLDELLQHLVVIVLHAIPLLCFILAYQFVSLSLSQGIVSRREHRQGLTTTENEVIVACLYHAGEVSQTIVCLQSLPHRAVGGVVGSSIVVIPRVAASR